MSPPEPALGPRSTRGAAASPGARSRRRTLTALLAVAAILLLAAGAAAAVHRGRTGGAPATSPRTVAAVPRPSAAAPSPVPTASLSPEQRRADAITALLARRGRAILHHDPTALLATIDPTQTAFRAEQRRLVSDLRDVPLASWSYELDSQTSQLRTKALARYHVPTYAPADIVLQYRLRGFDRRPTDLQQYPTFTRRHGRWYLASLSDFDRRGEVSATEVWDYGPVRVVRLPRVLVLGPPQQLATMREVAAEISAAIPRVDAVWGRHWDRRVVAQVPATQVELGRITADTQDLDQIAALSSAEVRSQRGDPAPVGGRVSINPENWAKLGPLGRRVVITHELTHVASRADTGYRMPTWLIEGFADYVGFRGTGIATTVAARELAAAVRAGRLPRALPDDRSFDGANTQLSEAYEGAWLACRYIAQEYGQPRLVAFYRQVGTSSDPPRRALADAAHELLHLTVTQLTARWRAFVRQQLG